MTKNNLFIKGAYLCTLETELTEEEFIEKAGGLEKLSAFKKFPFVTLALDIPKSPLLVGHTSGRTVNLVMTGHGFRLYQTMEWKRK